MAVRYPFQDETGWSGGLELPMSGDAYVDNYRPETNKRDRLQAEESTICGRIAELKSSLENAHGFLETDLPNQSRWNQVIADLQRKQEELNQRLETVRTDLLVLDRLGVDLRAVVREH